MARPGRVGSVTSILAAVDLSGVARRVADRARMIAEGHGVGLRLLHVAEPMGEAFISAEASKLVFDHRLTAIDLLLGWVRDRSRIEVEAEVLKGAPVWEIVRADRHVPLTVVGSSAVDQSLVGPVTLGVATFGRSDVLIVRRQPRAEYRRVVVGVDFSAASLAALHRVETMFPDAEVTAVYSLPTRFDVLMEAAGMFQEEVSSNRGARLELARRKLEELGVRGQMLAVDGSPIETLTETVRRRAADLLVLGTRGAGATKLTLLGTVAAGAATASPSDVLLVRSGGEFRRP